MRFMPRSTVLKCVFGAALMTNLVCANAAEVNFYGLALSKVRAVGDYTGTTFDNTLELYFTTPLVWPAGSPCVSTDRVFINANNMHLVAAAYLALSKGRKVDINIDPTLPIRYGACEISYIDLGAG
ncbi:hypothetical protein [Massilia sp. CF038]|uniref:hypothetical protein n=1 Tax=Massilia sp. CF038 TaxID=1881045 RepID=UPI000910672D|nr:hypothetical protein [Massilia sp. CF038]SHG47411.1 hypothetical protein SAMN05428948_0638 [Massilia sp. CF038]